MATVVQDNRLVRLNWKWHPMNPSDEFPLSEYTRIIKDGDVLRIEQRAFRDIDIVELTREEQEALLEFLKLEFN